MPPNNPVFWVAVCPNNGVACACGAVDWVEPNIPDDGGDPNVENGAFCPNVEFAADPNRPLDDGCWGWLNKFVVAFGDPNAVIQFQFKILNISKFKN